MRTSTLSSVKNFELLEIYGVSGGEGIKPVRIFFGQGRKGVNFSRFCADVLYGRPLVILQFTYLPGTCPEYLGISPA